MGQATKSDIAIFFNSDSVPSELASSTGVEQTMLKHYYETNPEAVGKPDITISGYEQYDGYIELVLYSTRRANLDFQIDLLNDYLETYHDDIIEEVTFDTWVQVD